MRDTPGTRRRPGESRWLVLIHLLPPKPGSFRVKIWRRLHDLGAIALKNSVYVLPNSERFREDFEWLLREILKGGGEGSVCEVSFVDGMTDEQVEALFDSARDADYGQIAREAKRLLEALPAGAGVPNGRRAEVRAQLKQLTRRLAAVAAMDFFGAAARSAAEGWLAKLEASLRAETLAEPSPDRPVSRPSLERAQKWTWVTRRGVHVDRMASAWLIRRFIDSKARFRFVGGNRHRPGANEVRFDMFEAEFTHEGDRCTFEVLLDAAGLEDAALRRIGQIVHDIDLKDGKYGHEETPGIERVIAGITLVHDQDEARLERGSALFDELYAYFRKKKAVPARKSVTPRRGVRAQPGMRRRAGSRRRP